jgi:hypothetical protein
MKDKSRKNKWLGRSFVSFFLLMMFVVTAVSGIALYFAPRGRDARWSDWGVWGIDKNMWISLHMVSGVAFCILGIIHLAYNWRVFKGYLRKKAGKVSAHYRELLAGLFVSALLVCLTLYNVTPLSFFASKSKDLRDRYAASITPPPWPRAGEVPISQLAPRLGLEISDLIDAIEKAGYSASPEDSLHEIAQRNNTSPMLVFDKAKEKLALDGKEIHLSRRRKNRRDKMAK